jgi:hypothetical protein
MGGEGRRGLKVDQRDAALQYMAYLVSRRRFRRARDAASAAEPCEYWVLEDGITRNYQFLGHAPTGAGYFN